LGKKYMPTLKACPYYRRHLTDITAQLECWYFWYWCVHQSRLEKLWIWLLAILLSG